MFTGTAIPTKETRHPTRCQRLGRVAGNQGKNYKANELAEELDKQPDEADGKPSRAKPNQAIAEELGDLLFSVVNLARKLDLDAETVLRQGNAKFEDRFGRVETALALAGKSPGEADLNEMEALWVAAKLDK